MKLNKEVKSQNEKSSSPFFKSLVWTYGDENASDFVNFVFIPNQMFDPTFCLSETWMHVFCWCASYHCTIKFFKCNLSVEQTFLQNAWVLILDTPWFNSLYSNPWVSFNPMVLAKISYFKIPNSVTIPIINVY